MDRDGLDADAAFAALATRSQRANIKLCELARQLVTEVSGQPARPVAGRDGPPAAVSRILPPRDFRRMPSHPVSTSDGAQP